MVNKPAAASDFENGLIQGNTSQFSSDEQLQLILKGILFSIKQEPDPNLIALLSKASIQSPYPDIALLCITTLADIGLSGREDAVEALFFLAVENRLNAAVLWLKQHLDLIPQPWQKTLFILFFDSPKIANQPDFLPLLTEAYLNSGSQTRAAILQSALGLNLINYRIIISIAVEHDAAFLDSLWESFLVFTKAEKILFYQLLKNQANSADAFIRDLTCRLVILFEDSFAQALALEQNWLSSNLVDQAAFLFLTQQWDDYLKLDFNRSLISNAFENLPDSVRKRLLSLSRQSGITDWLAGLSTRSQERWLNDLSEKEWRDTLTFSRENQLWAELWKLAQAAPVFWSQQILQAISLSSWEPDADKDFYHMVSALAGEAQHPLDITKGHILYAPGKVLTGLAYNEPSHNLAAGTKDQDILIWDTQNGLQNLPTVLQGPVALSRQIAFDPDGDLLATVNIDNAIRIYQMPEGKLIKTLTGHSNLVRSMIFHPDGRTLFSADFDGRVLSWRFPFGPLLNQIQPCKGEIYSLALSNNGNQLFMAGACGHIHGLDLHFWKEIKNLNVGKDIITHFNIFKNSPTAVLYTPGQKITVWNYDTEKIIHTFNLPTQTPIFSTVNLLTSIQMMVTGSNNGLVEIRSVENGEVMASASVAGSQTTITGTALSSSEDTLFTSTSEGKIYQWDLFPTLMVFTPVKKIGNLQNETIIQKIQSKPLQNIKTWLELASAFSIWNKRFDIHLVEDQRITLGEFDILI